MTDSLTPAALRARFAALGDERSAALAASTPLREERDAIALESSTKINQLNRDIADAEAGLYEIDQERALIARALGGRTGGE